MLSENDPVPHHNGPILTITQIIKFVMSSAAKAKLAGLFITLQEMVPIHQTLIKMGWSQPKSPIQTDNSTTHGVITNKIIPKVTKTMNMRFWWLHNQETQQEFRYYWQPGTLNWADYWIKHNPSSHHVSKRKTVFTSRKFLDAIKRALPTMRSPMARVC